MAIKIVISDTVGFTVKGAINDASGTAQPFDFKLKCVRLDTDQIKGKIEGNDADGSAIDFLADVVEDWSGVRDAEDKPLPYSKDSLRQLCKIPGIARLAYLGYINEVGAKEKNSLR